MQHSLEEKGETLQAITLCTYVAVSLLALDQAGKSAWQLAMDLQVTF